MADGALTTRGMVVLAIGVTVASLLAGFGLGWVASPGRSPSVRTVVVQLAACSSTNGTLPSGVSCVNVETFQAPASEPSNSSSLAAPTLVCVPETPCGNATAPSLTSYNADPQTAGDPVDVLTLQWALKCSALGYPPEVRCSGASSNVTYQVALTIATGSGNEVEAVFVATPPAGAGGWVSLTRTGTVTAQVEFSFDLGRDDAAALVSYAVAACSAGVCG